MIHSLLNTDRAAASWTLTSRHRDWLHHAAAAVRRRLRRFRPLGSGTPALRMSREWLEEYQRHSWKRPDGS
jgi:hypothetical protein